MPDSELTEKNGKLKKQYKHISLLYKSLKVKASTLCRNHLFNHTDHLQLAPKPEKAREYLRSGVQFVGLFFKTRDISI